MEGDIKDRIKRFKSNILDEENYSIEKIINQYIVFGTPYIFKDDEEKYYNLKDKIATFFEVNQRDIFMTGSSKLGFSIAPSKLWRPIDGNPNKDSDIDIVIISDRIFDKYWKSILEYKESTIAISDDAKNHSEFLEYFFKGWLRPDKFPYKYSGSNEWFEFFREVSYKKELGARKVAAAIYREEYFFEKYHTENLKGIRNILKGKGE
ncbi:hypothetical protein P4699_20305 [Priestia aryabhattai]|uniref:hypothetical protein n=1 Tax=Priestia aryabhattai TaxID=412384 RepID=UPI002E206C4B|nr:hypothetical protein [Priestia aryabhattai]